MDPHRPLPRPPFGVVLANERKFGAALPPLGKALELDAKSWEARWAMARCYYYQRNYEAAAQESRQALRDSDGKAPEIALVVAASLTALGRMKSPLRSCANSFSSIQITEAQPVLGAGWIVYSKAARSSRSETSGSVETSWISVCNRSTERLDEKETGQAL